MSSSDAGAYRRLFPAGHIPIILLSIIQAGRTLQKKADQELEDRITLRLYKGLIRIREFRDGPLDIRLQTEIPNNASDTDTPAGRIDLLVSCGHGQEVYFAIEAKKLRVRSPSGRMAFRGNSEYVTKGMMRFVTGQYAPKMEAGAMLGYVFDGEIHKARSSIDQSIQNKALKLKLEPPGRLVQSTILSKDPIDETRHDLLKRHFTIYHVFIAV
jgi:hypothetical protein